MPRTKVVNSKRNRDAGKEDKLKDFDMQLEVNLMSYEMKANEEKDILVKMIENMISALPKDILAMKLSDLQAFDKQKTIEEVKNTLKSRKDASTSLMLSSTKVSSKTDDGYSTEGNTTGCSDIISDKTVHLIPPSQFGRTPRIGMMSAKAKSRRSRSAGPPQGSILGSAMKSRNRPTATEHASRPKLKTPMIAPRPRATSADNDKIHEPKTPPRSPSSPATWLRWPKPGEKIISITGTPLVSHSAPEKFANVNIPVGDGVLSLRPKKLNEIDRSIVQKICPATMEQIKMLQSNLNRIMEFANEI